MGFLDKAKAGVKEAQEKAADLKGARGATLASIAAEYVGGYGEIGKASGILSLYQNQAEFGGPLVSKASRFTIPIAAITDIAVEGQDEVSRRVTVTRLLAVGILAFALKKKTVAKESFITLVLDDGQEIIFHVAGKSPLELKSVLAKATSRIRQT